MSFKETFHLFGDVNNDVMIISDSHHTGAFELVVITKLLQFDRLDDLRFREETYFGLINFTSIIAKHMIFFLYFSCNILAVNGK